MLNMNQFNQNKEYKNNYSVEVRIKSPCVLLMSQVEEITDRAQTHSSVFLNEYSLHSTLTQCCFTAGGLSKWCCRTYRDG